MRAATARRLVTDGVVVLLAITPLLYIASTSRGDDPPECPGKFAPDTACTLAIPTANCNTYNQVMCTIDKKLTVVYVGKFTCGGVEKTPANDCVAVVIPGTDPPQAGTSICSQTYQCYFDMAAFECSKGDQVGSTLYGPINKTVPCAPANGGI
ncbi:MAG TPA: hypothetical protein VH092_24970 [Urbifossiella sp.]|jgi:hypothetical protein|nr:hypothetical protein [Urbifossiella sp.]